MAKKGKVKATTRKATPRAQATAKRTEPTSKTSSRTPTSSRREKEPQAPVQMPFTRMNYIFLLIGVGIIALGFVLMSVDPFIDATQFSISLYVAPPVVVFGFMSVIYAIMYRTKSEKEQAVSAEG